MVNSNSDVVKYLLEIKNTKQKTVYIKTNLENTYKENKHFWETVIPQKQTVWQQFIKDLTDYNNNYGK